MSDHELTRMRDRLEAACREVAPEADPTFRTMFGGMGAYTQGRIFASLSDVGLALKLSPADQEELLREPMAKRLQYDPTSSVSKQYVVVPPAFVPDPSQLEPWVRRSVEFVLSAPAPKARR